MAKIINKESGQLLLPSGHVLPRFGEINLPNEMIRSPDNWPNLMGRCASGQIVIVFDDKVDPSDPEKTVAVESPKPEALTAVLLLDPPKSVALKSDTLAETKALKG